MRFSRTSLLALALMAPAMPAQADMDLLLPPEIEGEPDPNFLATLDGGVLTLENTSGDAQAVFYYFQDRFDEAEPGERVVSVDVEIVDGDDSSHAGLLYGLVTGEVDRDTGIQERRYHIFAVEPEGRGAFYTVADGGVERTAGLIITEPTPEPEAEPEEEASEAPEEGEEAVDADEDADAEATAEATEEADATPDPTPEPLFPIAHNLTLSEDGNSITLTVDGRDLDQLTSAAYGEGALGIVVWGNGTFRFQNFSVEAAE